MTRRPALKNDDQACSETLDLLTHGSNPENMASLPQVTSFSVKVVSFTMNPASHFSLAVSLYLTSPPDSTLPYITCGKGHFISEKG